MKSSARRLFEHVPVGLVAAAVFLAPAVLEAQMATGTYVGNGVDNRPITGLGFRPDAVFVKVDYANPTINLSYAVMRTSTMAGDAAKVLPDQTALAADLVQSLDNDGFTLGTAENVNGLNTCGGPCTYHWVAFKADANVRVSTYTGNGTTQALAGFGFSPDYVIVMPAGTRRSLNRTSRGTNQSKRFIGTLVTDGIVSMDADGMTVVNSATSSHNPNAAGQLYHYVAWNEVPGRVKVGEYPGNAADNRNITGVGFQPEFVIVQRYNEDREARMRTDKMVGDASGSFEAELLSNRIQAFQPDGFQIGDHDDVNSPALDCASGTTDCLYAWVAFGSFGGCCSALTTAEVTDTSVTVTAPNGWEMVFQRSTGGSPAVLYDLADDPTRTHDLAGGAASQVALIFDELSWNGDGTNYRTDKATMTKMDLLEAGPTRVQVRGKSFYTRGSVSTMLPGARASGIYTVLGTGRAALRLRSELNTSLDTAFQQMHLNVHLQSVAPLDSWAPYSQTGPLPPSNPFDDDFLLAKLDQPGARTDFLHVQHQDWPAATVVNTSSQVANEWLELTWQRQGNLVMPPGTQVFDFLTYFKPTNFIDHLDPAVLARSSDYRSPDDLASPLPPAAGGGWFDASENTASPSDFFNEAEDAYALDLDPVSGLTFDIDGGTTRFQPFFKIRQWRSLQPPATATLEGATLRRDTDFRADVMPISRAPFHRDDLWHTTLEDDAALTSPDIGTGGSRTAGVAFVQGRFGQGARVTGSGDWISMPTAGNFNKAQGSLGFWYRPTYDSTDGVHHDIFGFVFDANNSFTLEKRINNNLYFKIVAGGTLSELEVLATGYRWLPDQWVYLQVTWNDTAGSSTRQRFFMHDLEPNHNNPGNDYNSANLTVAPEILFGNVDGDALFAPGDYDEIEVNNGSAVIAHAGLVPFATEFLADPTNNFVMDFTPIDADKRGRYLSFGATAKFRGLNVGLATFGAGVPAGALQWDYWDGSKWTSLEAVSGFTDQTQSFTKNGSIFWTDDPPGWVPYAISGGVDIYRIRVYLPAGFAYTTFPQEGLIKTDVLFFQYCGEIAANDQTFSFSAPVPTAVELASFTARARDGAVDLGWTTGSELQNLGFHLYRSSGGPYERITGSVIPGLGSSPSGASYTYRDVGLVNGVTYRYELEDIETTGRTKRHGPASATPQAGLPPDEEGSGDASGPPPPASRTTYGDPTAVSLRVLERGTSAVLVELLTGGFHATTQADGTVRLEVPGFEELTSPGAPALPVKRTWLEAVAGRGAVIGSVRASDLEAFEGLRPADAGVPEVVVTPQGTVRAGRRKARAAWRGPAVYPAEPARVAETGFQGETKKALLELSPLRWDGSRLLLAKRLVVRVRFAGTEPSERALGGSRGRRHREDKSRAARTVLAWLQAPQRGLYRASFEEIFGPRRPAVAVSSLRLSRLGRTVPYAIEPPSSSFGPGSVLYFVSEGSAANAHSNDAVFALERAAGGAVMPVAPGAPWGSVAPTYVHRGEWEQNRFYQSGLLEAPSPWLWDVVISPNVKSYPFAVTARAPGAAQVEVWLQGASDFEADPDHHVRVLVNGILAAEASWDGKTAVKLAGEIAASVLREGENRLEVQNVGDTGASSSMVFLDRFAVSHPRVAASQAGVLEGRFTASGVAEVTGLGAGSLIVQTSPQVKWVRGSQASSAGLRFRVEAGRSYLAISPSAVWRAAVRPAVATTLRSAANRADYLLIGPREFLGAAEPLLAHRRSRGLVSKAVAIEDVYDEFGYGEGSPEAVKEFLQYAYHHWRPPSVRYVVLLGDATYDGKDYLGTRVANRVPALMVRSSYLWTASDPTYGAVNGEDLLPDVAVGRLPAASVAEALVLVEKALAFERAGFDLSGPAVLVSDDPDKAGDFEADSAAIASRLGAREVERIDLRQLGTAGTREAIVSAFDRGASLMSYVGHGGIALWASENVFGNPDVGSLSAQPRQPILMTMNCLNGYFHFPPMNSLSEQLLKAEGRGAVAAFSPSGLSLDEPAHVYQGALVDELVSGRHVRLGDAVLAAQRSYADTGLFPELLELYHLFGDPAMEIR